MSRLALTSIISALLPLAKDMMETEVLSKSPIVEASGIPTLLNIQVTLLLGLPPTLQANTSCLTTCTSNVVLDGGSVGQNMLWFSCKMKGNHPGLRRGATKGNNQ